VIEPNVPRVDAAGVEQEVQSMRRRPLLSGILVLAVVAFAIWYMTGGSATGSPHQAEQLILGTTNPAFASGSSVQSVHCTQDDQSIFTRVRGLFSGSGGQSWQGPATYYTCTGTSTTGPLYWCVSFPPRNKRYVETPEVTPNQLHSSCPS
jgi:hypothetical protein